MIWRCTFSLAIMHKVLFCLSSFCTFIQRQHFLSYFVLCCNLFLVLLNCDRASLSVGKIAQLVKIHLQCGKPQLDCWVGKIHWRRDRLPTPVFLGFPCTSAGKKFACNVGDLGSILGLGRSPGEGKVYPLQYSGQNSMDCIVHGVPKSWTQLSDFHFQVVMGW